MAHVPAQPASPLVRVLRQPEALGDLTAVQWTQVLCDARQARVLARIAVAARSGGRWPELPEAVRDHMTAALRIAWRHETMIRWEVDRLERALFGTDVPVMLLKGAAYVMAGLPAARGRLPTDIDILVRPSDLATVETALRARGWRPAKSDPYDDWYYRRHMHELPPLRHAVRGTIMDVHHTIAPPSGRLAIDAGRLWAEAVPLGGRLSVPSPATMIVHAAIHLFQNGEIGGELCELLDGHQLLSGFGDRAGFWDDLLTRTRDLGAARPVFYMLRYAEAVFGTAVPAWVWSRLGVPASPLAVRVMDGLVPKALVPPVRGDLSGAAARGALYLRGHWLRMPPRPLLRHLLRKSARATGLPSFPPA